MSMIEDSRKLMQDFLAPELRAISARLDALERRFENVDKRFENVDKRFVNLDKRFDTVDKRFEMTDRKIDEVDRRAEKRHDALLSQLGTIDGKLDTLVDSIDMKVRLARLEERFLSLRAEGGPQSSAA